MFLSFYKPSCGVLPRLKSCCSMISNNFKNKLKVSFPQASGRKVSGRKRPTVSGAKHVKGGAH